VSRIGRRSIGREWVGVADFGLVSGFRSVAPQDVRGHVNVILLLAPPGHEVSGLQSRRRMSPAIGMVAASFRPLIRHPDRTLKCPGYVDAEDQPTCNPCPKPDFIRDGFVPGHFMSGRASNRITFTWPRRLGRDAAEA